MKIYRITNNIILVGILMISISSCLSTKNWEKQEEQEIQNYLAAHPDEDWVLKLSGLYYLEVQAGSGEAAEVHDTAFIFYTAKYLNGITFQTNVGTTDTLLAPVAEGFLIEGFDEGLTYMKAGGKSLFLVPSYLGYGQSGIYFPAYTPILYDVHLVKIIKGP